MLVAGVSTGMALAGTLPGLGPDISPAAGQIETPISSPNSSEAGIPLEFPDLPWLHQADGGPGAQELALAVTEPTQESAQPQVIVQEVVAPPTPECIKQVTGAVSGLVAGVAGATTLDLAQALDVQARAILEAANNCAAQASAVGQAVDQANVLVQQVTTVTAQITGLVGQLMAPAQGAAPGTQPATPGAIATAVGGVLGLTTGVVNTATGILGGVLSTVLGQK
jgi:hypothetical protein